MAGKRVHKSVEQDSRYHDTWRLLKKYRDVIWSMELSVQQLRKEFECEYGSSVDDFLESVYMAGADLSGTQIENHARCIERSRKMLSLVDSAADLLRTKHKNGEAYYWILYYTYLSPQKVENINIIIEQLQPYIAVVFWVLLYCVSGKKRWRRSAPFCGGTPPRTALLC